MYTTCSELVVFMYLTRNSMNNLLSYCGLIDARISASEKRFTCTDEHNEEEKYTCQICGERYPSERMLNVHMEGKCSPKRN